MRYTDRLDLKLPDQDDAYQVDDFNHNYQKITESFAGIPISMECESIDEFVKSKEAESMKRGDTVDINNLIYILLGPDPKNKDDYKPYGSEALVIMEEYIPPSERTKGSMYFQIGNEQDLIIKVFKEFYHNLMKITASTAVQSGVAFAVMKDHISANGAATESISFLVGTVVLYKDTIYELRGCPENGTEDTYKIELESGSSILASDTGSGVEYTPTETINGSIYIRISGSYIAENLIFTPRITVVNGCTGGNEFSMYFSESPEKIVSESDGNKYSFCCKNLVIVQPGDNPERVEGKLYFEVDSNE